MKTILKKMNLPKILIGLVLTIALILGLPAGSDNLLALAGQKKDNSQDNNLPAQVTQQKDNAQFDRQAQEPYSESLNQKQTENSKSFVEKLNLNEPLPKSTKKFFKQVQGQEPIENTTPPYLEKSKPAQ